MNCRRAPQLLLVALLVSSPVLAGDVHETLEPRSADRGALEQAMAESRVEISPHRPGLTLYVSDAGIAVSTWLAEVLESWLPGFGRLADWFLAASWGLLISVLAVVSAIVVIGLARRWWKERSQSPPAPGVTPLPPAAPPAQWPAKRWQEELRRRLGDGDVNAAVEALWWWLASVLTAAGAEPSWTSRELIVRAGRVDLKPLIRRLDRMIYGPEVPPAEDVRDLFRDLREAA